jgi:hypothetical protein
MVNAIQSAIKKTPSVLTANYQRHQVYIAQHVLESRPCNSLLAMHSNTRPIWENATLR